MLMEGAQPFIIEGNSGKVGCLLLHSLTSSPREMRELGEHLAARGITVSAPLLAGHGTRPSDLITQGWQNWLQSAREGLGALRNRCDGSIFLCGQSVGGLLSLYLAGEEEIAGIISIGAALYLKNLKITLFLPLAKHTFISNIYRYDRPIAYDINDPEGREAMVCYDRTPVKSVVSLVELKEQVRGMLPSVQVPLLVAHGALDTIVPPGNMETLAAETGTDRVETLLCPRSKHLVTMDYDRHELFNRIHCFIEKQKAN